MDTLQKALITLPHSPGVYLFKNSDGTILYVGKARNVNKRVRHYFSRASQLPEKTRQLVAHIHTVRIIQVATEFEALLLEAKLIRAYVPKYNSIAKDDKSPIYIHIQKKQSLPRVLITRKPKIQEEKNQYYFGPFATRKIATRLLREIRHSIPFCQQKIRNGKPCFYTHLRLCYPCPSVIEKMPEGIQKKALVRMYKTQIKRLCWALSGHTNKTIQSMQKDMDILSRRHNFEQAAILRDQIHAFLTMINSRYDPFLFEETDKLEKAPGQQVAALLKFLQPHFSTLSIAHRIECYDISVIQGTSSVGSMIVFMDGIPHTDQYRRFKISGTNNKSDVAMMREVVERRLKHNEWPYPELIVIDGGKAQVACIYDLLLSQKISRPVIGLAKRFEQIIIRSGGSFQTETIPLSDQALQLIQHMRDEAHRFALSYHKKLRSLQFAQNIPHLI
jgi:excinuclease ABC subunit C